MAAPNEKNNPTTPTQLDVEFTAIDRANKAVRDYQGGKCTLAFCRDRLKEVRPQELSMVALGTRVPLEQIRTLRGE